VLLVRHFNDNPTRSSVRVAELGEPRLYVCAREVGIEERCCVGVRDVAGAVAAHHCLHPDVAFGEPVDGAAQKRDRAGGAETVEQLGVGEPGVGRWTAPAP
jgi:hypothetical protein